MRIAVYYFIVNTEPKALHQIFCIEMKFPFQEDLLSTQIHSPHIYPGEDGIVHLNLNKKAGAILDFFIFNGKLFYYYKTTIKKEGRDPYPMKKMCWVVLFEKPSFEGFVNS